jgi:excisionase family DNA binding protein
MTPRLAYSLAEAAEALSLSLRSVRYLMQTGKLGYARVGRRILIPHAELERFLRRASVKATQQLDADEPIRPRKELLDAPSGELGAQTCRAHVARASQASAVPAEEHLHDTRA